MALLFLTNALKKLTINVQLFIILMGKLYYNIKHYLASYYIATSYYASSYYYIATYLHY